MKIECMDTFAPNR